MKDKKQRKSSVVWTVDSDISNKSFLIKILSKNLVKKDIKNFSEI